MLDQTSSGLSSNELLASLPHDTFALLQRDLRQVSLAQGVVCFEAGQPIDNIYFPHSGLLSLTVPVGKYSAVEISSVGSEGGVGLQCGLGRRQAFVTACVRIAGTFSIISSVRFEYLAEDNHALRDIAVRSLETCLVEAQQRAACNAVHSALGRLSRWLLQTADRARTDRIPVTQECLSKTLGLRRTTVTLLAQQLNQLGAIRTDRGKIVILERSTLEESSCDCRRNFLAPQRTIENNAASMADCRDDLKMPNGL